MARNSSGEWEFAMAMPQPQPLPAPRTEAAGPQPSLEPVYDEIRDTLQISWVPSTFRALGGIPDYLRLAWEQLEPAARTAQFARLAGRIRQAALAVVQTLYLPGYGLGDLQQLAILPDEQAIVRSAMEALLFGESQALLATKALRLAIECSPPGGQQTIWWPRAPTTWAMEPIPMVDLATVGQEVRGIFAQARRILHLPSTPRSLEIIARWPRYLALAWTDLRAVFQTAEFGAAQTELIEQSVAYSQLLPFKVNAIPAWLKQQGLPTIAVDRAREILLEYDRTLPAELLLTACLRLPLGGHRATG